MPEQKSRRIPKSIWFAIPAVLMVVLAVILSVWLPYHREQVAIREIEREGGEVFLILHGPEWIEDSPEWLQDKIVYDDWLSWFKRVELVELASTEIGNDNLKHLSGLKNLFWLDLADTKISDEGLSHLSSLTHLSFLFLYNTQVTDEGVKKLQRALPDCKISLTKSRQSFIF